MTYNVPPLSAFLAAATNAVANTNTTHTILVAAVGTAIRAMGVRVVGARANTGPIQIDIQDSAGTNVLGSLGLTGAGDSDTLILPSPGFLLTTGLGFQLVSSSTVASQGFRFVLFYYNDPQT